MKNLKILFLLILNFSIISCVDKREKTGEELIAKIEMYKNQTSRLPNKVEDIGIAGNENGPVYYTKKSDSTYIVYYGGSLGESIIYNFETMRWESDHQ